MLGKLSNIGIVSMAFILICSGCVKEVKEKEYGYKNITPEEAKNLIENDKNLLIIDVRICPCEFSEAHIPGATWSTNPKKFYNTTHDLLIYSEDGKRSEDFCKRLVGHVYGKIYNLDGGIEAWKAAGYGLAH